MLLTLKGFYKGYPFCIGWLGLSVIGGLVGAAAHPLLGLAILIAMTIGIPWYAQKKGLPRDFLFVVRR